LLPGANNRVGIIWISARFELGEIIFAIAIGITALAPQGGVVDLMQRQTGGLPTGKVNRRCNANARDERIRVSSARVDPNRDRWHIHIGRFRNSLVIAQHVTRRCEGRQTGVG
jgi:hypothetical protein